MSIDLAIRFNFGSKETLSLAANTCTTRGKEHEPADRRKPTEEGDEREKLHQMCIHLFWGYSTKARFQSVVLSAYLIFLASTRSLCSAGWFPAAQGCPPRQPPAAG